MKVGADAIDDSDDDDALMAACHAVEARKRKLDATPSSQSSKNQKQQVAADAVDDSDDDDALMAACVAVEAKTRKLATTPSSESSKNHDQQVEDEIAHFQQCLQADDDHWNTYLQSVLPHVQVDEKQMVTVNKKHDDQDDGVSSDEKSLIQAACFLKAKEGFLSCLWDTHAGCMKAICEVLGMTQIKLHHHNKKAFVRSFLPLDVTKVAAIRKVWDDHGGDKTKICAALHLPDSSWTSGMTRDRFEKLFHI